MSRRREKALVKLVSQIAFRDALEAQMEAIEQYKRGLNSERVKRQLNVELARIRGKFNTAQARIETMQGRLLPVTRELVTDEVKLDPHVAECGLGNLGGCSDCGGACT